MNGICAKTGVLLCGHGSRDEETRIEFDIFVAAVRNALSCEHSFLVDGAYLEFAHPTIGEGFTKIANAGVEKIAAQPLMLFAARHAKNDVPEEARAFAASHPGIRISCGQDLSPDAKMLAAAVDRVNEAETLAMSFVARSHTLLLVIGRGSSDSEANRTLAELAHKLCDALGMAKTNIAFAGIAEPNVADGLDLAARQGFSRIIVFPYFLFTGVLVKRIRAAVENAARKYPTIEMLVARHLANHPLVVETVVDRILDLERPD
jgi:sirohydrochlorin cobaltochelatase